VGDATATSLRDRELLKVCLSEALPVIAETTPVDWAEPRRRIEPPPHFLGLP
jgi:hypothetical protein